MRFRARVRAVTRAIPRLLLLLWGLRFIERNALAAFGGWDKLWLFDRMEQHRFTAMAMLTGTLRLRGALSKVLCDEQTYNGAGYTNWGFGAPLLQIPFHAAAPHLKWIHEKFFPDRAIYLAYFAALVPVLWAAFDRLLAMREPPGAFVLRRHALSWAATLLVVSSVFYPLMSCRFMIYEETTCYFLVAEFFALAAFIYSLRRGSRLAVAGLGVAAGLGLLIRPTGLVYVGVWGVLVVLERRRIEAAAAYLAGVAPLVAFWLFSNFVRSGSVFAFGLNNSTPMYEYHTPILRFGSQCATTPTLAWHMAKHLFIGLFAGTEAGSDEWMHKCHFDFEERQITGGDGHAPFFGVAVLIVLVWTLLHQLVRRERRLAFYVPVLAFVALFAAYVRLGGFAWRYVGDFWPLVVLACVQYVRFLPTAAAPLLGVRLALTMLAVAFAMYMHEVRPSLSTIETLSEDATKKMWDDFTNSRYAGDPISPSLLRCGAVPSTPWANGRGWSTGCGVSTYTNVYLGVPEKSDTRYRIDLETEGMKADWLRVYVNGRIYTARRQGDHYVADVEIQTNKLSSWAVMATVEWVRTPDPPDGKLLSVELK